MSSRIEIHVHLDDQDRPQQLDELRRGLLEDPPRISSRYFYDDHGSRLFEQITELPEYYQTRTERRLLRDHARSIVETTGAEVLVEVGSGAAEKTRVLLDAMQNAGTLKKYIPLDVSDGILRRSSEELIEIYPGLEVEGIVGNFMKHLGEIPTGGQRLFVFLGGTIGNLGIDTEALDFLSSLRDAMSPADHLLLGTDLIKDEDRLHAAYNDSQGVTADFNLNMLRVANAEFGANFEPTEFRHRAFYNAEKHRIEMRLVATESSRVRFPEIDFTLAFEAGEELLTEISTKFDRPKVETLYERSGLALLEWYCDVDELFALSLSKPQ